MKLYFTILTILISQELFSQSGEINVNLSKGAIDLEYAGIARLAGGVPKIENKTLNGGVQKLTDNSFLFGTTGEAIHVLFKKSIHPNVIGLYMSASKYKVSGNEFLGFFFSSSPGYREGVAFYRYKPWNSWTKPMHIKSLTEVESWDNQCVYWRYEDGTYGVAIPIGDKGYRTTLGSEQESFGSKAVSYIDGHQTDSIPSMVIGFGDNLYTLMKDVYQSGLTFMGNPENSISKKVFPEPMKYIGWCTWNASAQGAKLNEETVIKGVESFTKNNFPLGWVLFDDGWFDHKNSQLRSLRPDTLKFPSGFSPLIKRLKNEFHLQHVGVWHAFNGYWNGIDPNSELGERYKNELFSWVQKERVDIDSSPQVTYHFIKPTSDSLKAFYNSLHAYLKKEGVTFVKVDNQLSVERMSPGNFPIGQLAKTMHNELNSSVKKYFDNAIINCMDMTSDAFYNFGSTPIARSVEDYFPFEENENYNLQRGNAAAHILQGIYNNLYFSQMLFPDLDMFQSHNPNGEYHAIARAINNGPIYITDNVGEQNFKILNRLVLHDGKILRADQPLLPTRDCLFQIQERKLFKAFSQSNGIGLLGVWNAADADSVSGSVSPSDIENFGGDQFAMYEVFSGKVKICDYQNRIPVTLNRMGYQLYYVGKLKRGAAPFGILGKYNAPATIHSYSVSKNRMKVLVKEGGKFGAALTKKPKKVLINGKRENNYIYKNELLTIQLPTGKPDELIEIEIILD